MFREIHELDRRFWQVPISSLILASPHLNVWVRLGQVAGLRATRAKSDRGARVIWFDFADPLADRLKGAREIGRWI